MPEKTQAQALAAYSRYKQQIHPAIRILSRHYLTLMWDVDLTEDDTTPAEIVALFSGELEQMTRNLISLNKALSVDIGSGLLPPGLPMEDRLKIQLHFFEVTLGLLPSVKQAAGFLGANSAAANNAELSFLKIVLPPAVYENRRLGEIVPMLEDLVSSMPTLQVHAERQRAAASSVSSAAQEEKSLAGTPGAESQDKFPPAFVPEVFESQFAVLKEIVTALKEMQSLLRVSSTAAALTSLSSSSLSSSASAAAAMPRVIADAGSGGIASADASNAVTHSLSNLSLTQTAEFAGVGGSSTPSPVAPLVLSLATPGQK